MIIGNCVAYHEKRFLIQMETKILVAKRTKS